MTKTESIARRAAKDITKGYDIKVRIEMAIKEALAQPAAALEHLEPVATLFGSLPVYDTTPSQQEPVAFVKGCNRGQWEIFPAKAHQIFGIEQPLYTTPPQRKPLPYEKVVDLWLARFDTNEYDEVFMNFARAIEAAHGIKE